MNNVEYYFELLDLGLCPSLIELAMEFPGYSVPHETALCLLRYAIEVTRLSKTKAVYTLARFVALLDARRNTQISEADVEAVFDQIFKKLLMD